MSDLLCVSPIAQFGSVRQILSHSFDCFQYTRKHKNRKNVAGGLLAPPRAQFPRTSATFSRQNHSLKKACLLLALLPLHCLLAGGAQYRCQGEITATRVGYTFPGGCWRPFWGFPHRTPNTYYETFHLKCLLQLSATSAESIFFTLCVFSPTCIKDLESV